LLAAAGTNQGVEQYMQFGLLDTYNRVYLEAQGGLRDRRTTRLYLPTKGNNLDRLKSKNPDLSVIVAPPAWRGGDLSSATEVERLPARGCRFLCVKQKGRASDEEGALDGWSCDEKCGDSLDAKWQGAMRCRKFCKGVTCRHRCRPVVNRTIVTRVINIQIKDGRVEIWVPGGSDAGVHPEWRVRLYESRNSASPIASGIVDQSGNGPTTTKVILDTTSTDNVQRAKYVLLSPPSWRKLRERRPTSNTDSDNNN